MPVDGYFFASGRRTHVNHARDTQNICTHNYRHIHMNVGSTHTAQCSVSEPIYPHECVQFYFVLL